MERETHWHIKPGQQADHLFWSYGTLEPEGVYTEPLVTIESDGREVTRYFERLTDDEWMEYLQARAELEG